MTKFTITLDAKAWTEIFCAIQTKIRLIEMGHYGEEERPGEDAQWLKHLYAIKKEIDAQQEAQCQTSPKN